MDSITDHLHSNWRALVTTELRLKRFVREGEPVEAGHTKSPKYSIGNVTGTEIKQFYDNLVKRNENSKQLSFINEFNDDDDEMKNKVPKVIVKRLEPFNKNKFFHYATNGETIGLQSMDYQNADINCCDTFGWTSLMMAACEGSVENTKFLLKLGVNKEIKNKNGQTAMDLAKKRNHYYIFKLLANDNKVQVEINILRKHNNETKVETFYCDICQRNFESTNKNEHETSTLHMFNKKPTLPANKLNKFNIGPRNRGLQLMVKQGWDKESGLGPEQNGRLYPVKTCIRKNRTGLGIEQAPSRVTHFNAFDLRATQRNESSQYESRPHKRNDMRREKIREWKRDRRLRNELS